MKAMRPGILYEHVFESMVRESHESEDVLEIPFNGNSDFSLSDSGKRRVKKYLHLLWLVKPSVRIQTLVIMVFGNN